jgi:selenocysteine-specific elongation factor
MEIQPIVIGTAGHIDHGKSTLVHALTGIDPDRLKEEKERGLTIDLGFAPLVLPDGRRVGMIDVPGHERFVRNMVAGATGIDLVVLVVAADDGVMPQTREHLQIMRLLGVARGLVALTKIDKTEPEMIDMAEEDVRANVRGTFLEDAPLFRVSARTGEGMDALRAALYEMASATEPRPADGIFRMPIQRVFKKSGFGTVVTGVPQAGSARVGDVLEVLPAAVRGKVRGLNAYMERTEQVRAGHSSAINLADVDHALVKRGDVVATPGFFVPQRMLAARFEALGEHGWSVTNRMPVRLHTGTLDAPGEVVLLDKQELAPGETGLVQLRLQDPIVCAPGDRFILRLLSPGITLGGGVILEESRHRLKRFKDFVIEGLERQERSLSSARDRLESALLGRDDPLVSTDDAARELKQPRDETSALLEELREVGRLARPRSERWIHVERLAEVRARVGAAIEAWFAAEPHRSLVDVLELRRRTALAPLLLDVALEAEEAEGRLERLPGGRIRPRGRTGRLAPGAERARAAAHERFRAARFQPPTESELALQLALSAGEVHQALEALVDEGVLVHVGGELYLSTAATEEARLEVIANCERHGHLEIPELRDRLGTSRKFLIPLLEHFDARGVTIRQGANRVLRRNAAS